MEELVLFCKQSDYGNIAKTLLVKPYSHEQITSILYIMLNQSEFAKMRILEFVASSQRLQWSWCRSNPDAIHYFSIDGEILAAVLKSLKMIFTVEEFTSFCKRSLNYKLIQFKEFII